MKKKPIKLFVIELIFFLATLLLGVFVAHRLSEVFNIAYGYGGGGEEAISPVVFVIYFLIATLIVFLVSKSERMKKGRLFFFKFAFLFSVALGGTVTFSAFLPGILPLFVIVLLLLGWQQKPVILLHNLLITISIAGIGAVMGSVFDPVVIAGLLIIFSVYDFIAVYKTKHMVKMATEMIKTKAIMGLVIPFNFSDLLDNLEDKEKKEFMVLGGGDLAFPLFLISSVTLRYGIKEALLIVAFSGIGLFLSFYLFIIQKTRKPIPALPPIALMAIIAYLIIAFF